MNTANKIFSNTAWQTGLRATEVVTGVLTLGLITRYLGQIGFGHFTTINAFLQLFVIVIDFGLYLTLLREISANTHSETEKITNNIFTIRLLTSAVFLFIAVLAVQATPYPADIKRGVAALSIGMLSMSLITTLTALFQKSLMMAAVGWLNALSRAILLIVIAAVIRMDLGLQGILFSTSAISVAAFIVMLLMLHRLPHPLRLRLRFDFAYWRVVVSKTWPLAVTTALNLIYFKADTVILSVYQSQQHVGLYGASYRILETVSSFPHMFMGLILPLMTAAWIAGNVQSVRAIWERAFVFFAFITFPMVAGTMVVARPLMLLIAGPKFGVSGSILRVLIVAAAAMFFGALYTYVVLTLERQRQMIKYFAATAILAMAGYLVAIPLFSYWGAAWVTVISEAAIIAGAWLVARPAITLRIPWTVVGRLAIASALMAFGVWMLSRYPIPLIALICVGMALYFSLCLAFRAITLTELRRLIRPSV